MIDLHCHLDLYSNPRQVVAGCKARGLYVLSVTTTPSAWKETQGLAIDAPRIRTALGLHPQLAAERIGELPLFEQLITEVRYVGEIGLDGSPEQKQHRKDQQTVFNKLLSLCSQHGGRVMSIHSRRAVGDVLASIAKVPDAGTPVLHWFSGTQRELQRAVDLGCWFSVGPAMLTTAKGIALARAMPKDRVLTETDGPFAQVDGHIAMPWDAELAVPMLAELWNTDINDAKACLRNNLQRLAAMTK